jgi:hypothetical protein
MSKEKEFRKIETQKQAELAEKISMERIAHRDS